MAVFLNFDGSCARNPGGPGGWGWCLAYANGDQIAFDFGQLSAGPEMTCNVAEWHGLINGLEYIATDPKMVDAVVVRGDSQLVIEQAAGRWRVKAEHLRRLADRARRLVKQIGRDRVQFEWVPREKNRECDRLSKGLALQSGAESHSDFDKPGFIRMTLQFAGATKKNPGGPGGYGWRLLRPDGYLHASACGEIPKGPRVMRDTTALQGLLAGLEHLRDNPTAFDHVLVRGDNRRIVQIAAGDRLASDRLLEPVVAHGHDLIRQIGRDRIAFEPIPEKENRECVDLARSACRSACIADRSWPRPLAQPESGRRRPARFSRRPFQPSTKK